MASAVVAFVSDGNTTFYFVAVKAVAIAKGSAEPHKSKVGKITAAQIEEIAKIKMPDLNCFDVNAAIRMVRGTARSMGVEVPIDA